MAEHLISRYIERYKNFVINNPLIASELEVALRWMSFLAAGRFSQSAVISELMHASSNLLTLVNDVILRKAANFPSHVNSTIEKLRTILSVIEYVEVFAEITGRLINSKTRWLIIAILQLVKTGIRFLLLIRYKQGLDLAPPIPPLNRRIDVPQLCHTNGDVEVDTAMANLDFTFTLKRSGRVVRTLETSPPLSSRNWKVPEVQSRSRLRNRPTQLQGKDVAGEILHLSRPLSHLLLVSRYGTYSWKPWFAALTIDLISLQILRKNQSFNQVEKLELSRRVLMLLLYIIRTPFYDNFSRNQILAILTAVSNTRIIGHLIRPIIQYLPEWQQIYFYTWVL